MNLSTTPKPRDVGFDAAFNPNLKPLMSHHYFPVERHVQYVEYAVLSMVALNILGLGGQVNGETLFKLIQSPLVLTCAMFCRLALMPAILLGLILLLSTGHACSLSCLCLLMSPSEGASSLLVLLAEADVDLCFALVTFNAFTTTAVLPLWAILFERELYGYAGELGIPFSQIFIIFAIIVSAGFLGYLFCQKWPQHYDRYWENLPVFTVFTLLCVISVELYCNFAVLCCLSVLKIALALIISILGFLLGAGIGYILCQSKERTVTLALEIGVRTSYITNLCASMSYPQSEAVEAKTAAVLCSILTIIPAFIWVMVVRFQKRLRLAKEQSSKCQYVFDDGNECTTQLDIQ